MEAREAWFEGQLDLNPERVVFLDETATATNMERRYGRAPRGERCRLAVPHGHYKTTTVTAALRASGPFAVELMDGATNGARFLSYVTDTLGPALKPGDTVVMDNLAAHKVAGVRQTIEAAGAHLLYLPAYSPDFNPIEFDVFTGAGRRRSFTRAEKAAIVEESYAGGDTVCGVARRHSLTPRQLFGWRRLARLQPSHSAERSLFVPVIVSPEPEPPSKGGSSPGSGSRRPALGGDRLAGGNLQAERRRSAKLFRRRDRPHRGRTSPKPARRAAALGLPDHPGAQGRGLSLSVHAGR